MPAKTKGATFLTIRLPRDVHARLKRAAEQDSRAMSAWALLVLRAELDRIDQPEPINLKHDLGRL